MTHSNSSAAYGDIKSTGELGTQQRIVLDSVTASQGTRQDIASRTNLTINAVCGRVKELIDAGLIEEVGTDQSTGRKRAILGAAKSGAQQLSFRFRT